MSTWSLRGDAENAGVFLVDGWESYAEGPPGDGYRWSISRTARVVIPAPPPSAGPAQLRMQLQPFVHEGAVPVQEVWVFANGLFVLHDEISRTAELTGIIPSGAWTGATVGLTLLLPRADQPSRVGASADARTLGVALRQVELVS